MAPVSPYAELIALELERGRNATGIWQDLVDSHGFAGGYQSIKRHVRKLHAATSPEARAVSPHGQRPSQDPTNDFSKIADISNYRSPRNLKDRRFQGSPRKPANSLFLGRVTACFLALASTSVMLGWCACPLGAYGRAKQSVKVQVNPKEFTSFRLYGAESSETSALVRFILD
jgi:hypothetical protein